MVLTPLVTLTDDNILDSEKAIGVKLYEYFIASEFSQTRHFPKGVASLKYLLAQYQHDMRALETNAQETLELLYGKYIEPIEINVKVEVEQGFGKIEFAIWTPSWSLRREVKVDSFKLELLDGFTELNMEGTHHE